MKNNEDILKELFLLWNKEYPLQNKNFLKCYIWKEEDVQLSDISFKRRGRLSKKDENKVGLYIKMINDGFSFASVVVLPTDKVIDGIHRCYAYDRFGISQIKSYHASFG